MFDVATILGAWTDSTIVLAWIQKPSRSWKTFVANRVGEIHEAVGSPIWHHIRTEENPADCLSRGTTVDQLIGNTLWWKGPKWLELPYSEWPDKTHVPPTELEERNPPSHAFTVLEQPGFETKYSSLSRLLRVTAYCRRFINNTRFGFLPPGTKKELISDELHEAMTTWIKVYQERAFHLELRALRDDHALPRRSPLSSLQPFLDDHEIIRVGGRLKHSSMSFERKHPIVLPAGNHFVDLIIHEAHCNTLHGGPTLVLATLRCRFWILHARRLVKSCISRCIVCTRYSRSATEQQMGDLPAPRVNVSRPFAHVGVDFCGPFLIKRTKHSQHCHKAWVAIFICLAVKAIHLEYAGDLSTPTFLAALRRFFARRGLCTDIYSDRGTNFVGAEKILSKLLVQPVVHQELAHQGITWHFMPPAAPHFGGLWEAGVKSFKRHFYRVVGQANLTIEEFITICAQIEACLNSRPLCPLSDSPDDATALTPGHFLIGDALLSHPDPSINKVQLQHPTRWQHQQRLTQHWWKRWSSEYLNRLQQRPKWLHERPNLQEGDLVLIKEDNLPPARWKMGRIVSTHPGTDGLVRVVTIRVGNSQLLRPITRICRLPINAPPS